MFEKTDRLTIKLVGGVDASAERPLPAVPHGASGLAGITDHASIKDDLASLNGSSSSLSELGGGGSRGGGGRSSRGGGGRGGRLYAIDGENVLSDDDSRPDSELSDVHLVFVSRL